MTNWKDSAGREWSLHLTVLEMDRLRDASGVNLYDIVKGELKLSDDQKKAFDLAWASIESKAGEVTREVFNETFDGTTMENFAVAIDKEIIRFFPSAQRPLAEKIINRKAELREAGAKILSQATNEMIDQAISSVLSGNSSASPAQTPEVFTPTNP